MRLYTQRFTSTTPHPHAVYTNSDNASVPITREVRSGRGKEARSYLAAILDHWDDLPDAIAFMHAHRRGACGAAYGRAGRVHEAAG